MRPSLDRPPHSCGMPEIGGQVPLLSPGVKIPRLISDLTDGQRDNQLVFPYLQVDSYEARFGESIGVVPPC